MFESKTGPNRLDNDYVEMPGVDLLHVSLIPTTTKVLPGIRSTPKLHNRHWKITAILDFFPSLFSFADLLLLLPPIAYAGFQ